MSTNALRDKMHDRILIAPDGGHYHLSPVQGAAEWLNAHGVAAFVLKYRLGMKHHNPVELEDAQRTIRLVRAHAVDEMSAELHVTSIVPAPAFPTSQKSSAR